LEVKANMFEEYKKFSFPSPVACKSGGRKEICTAYFQVAEDQNENVRGASNIHPDAL
jgi:undecaprenyl pyrophosphate synthase